MTEHMCEWSLAITDTGKIVSFCLSQDDSICTHLLDREESERRLNEYETLKKATEALTAEDARTIAKVWHKEERLNTVLQAYADILEGK